MKILILSDLHLDTPRGELKRFDIEDAEVAIRSLKQYTEGIDAVVIAGDIFNAVKNDSVPFHLLSMLKETLKDIPQKYTIRGNHDRARFSILEDMLGYKALTWEKESIGCGLSISGCDFTDIDTHREYLATADSDILVCHFPMSPFSTFRDSNISVNECPEGKVVIVGDTHKPDVYAQDDRCVISPGCLFPANKSELLSGYAGSGFILDISKEDGDMKLAVGQISLETRFGVDLSAIKTKDELVLGLKTIEAREPFPSNLRPVAYIDSSLSDITHPKIECIPVSTATDSVELTADFSGLEGEGIDARIKRILTTLYAQEAEADKLLELTIELIATDEPKVVLDSFIRQ